MASVGKKIVLFADGTGNSSSSPQKTNVWRTYKALDVSQESRQIAFYDNGVGTSSFQPLALVGQVFGFGLANNVKQIYGFLCRNYKAGDKIYAYGFSRGAFTMRVVVGLVASQGIIDVNQADDDADVDRLISQAYSKFRRDEFTGSLVSFFWDKIGNVWRRLTDDDKSYSPKWNLKYIAPEDEGSHEKAKTPGKKPDKELITFVGLWDTVAAYGLPIDEFTRAWDTIVWPLTANDRNLSDRVGRACHALALDEQRLSFAPMLWNEMPDGKAIDGKKLCQVWFAGVHANVGGSYPDDSLSFVALNWMFDQSETAGLQFLDSERQFYSEHANVNGRMYDNRAGLGNLYRYAPRKLKKLCDEIEPNLLTRFLTICCSGDDRGKSGILAWLFPFLCVQKKEKNSKFWKFLNFFGVRGLQFNKVKISSPKIHHSVFERIESGCCSYAPINLPADYVVVNQHGKVEKPKQIEVSKSKPQKSLATGRYAQQQYVWNKVWARKVLYYITFIFICLFVAYPYIAKDFLASGTPSNGAEKAIGALWTVWQGIISFFESLLGGLSNVIRLIPIYLGKFPGLGFVEKWATRFAEFQIAFLIFVAIIGGLLLKSNGLNIRLKSEMNDIWQSILKKGKLPDLKVSKRQKRLAKFLDGETNRKLETALARSLETLAVVFFFMVLVLSLVNHTALTVVDGFGGVCKSSDPGKVLQRNEMVGFDFEAQDPCKNSGVTLLKDRRYKLTFEVTGGVVESAEGPVPANWKDGENNSIIADVNGWKSAPWPYYLATPYRRHWFAGWFQPIIRIDNILFDIFPMQNTDPVNKDSTSIVMLLDVKRGGNLFVYLNDAVVLHPSFVSKYYRNNVGIARVTVTDITPASGTTVSAE